MRFLKPIAILICLITITAGCEKRPFDFRRKWVGDWEFDHIVREEGVNAQVIEEFTSEGRVDCGTTRGTLVINFGPDHEVVVDVGRDGEIQEYDDSSIDKENLEINERIVYGGPTTTWRLIGRKLD